MSTPETPKSYVYPLPDHVDRVVWRGRYLHLDALAAQGQTQPAAPQAAPAVPPGMALVPLEPTPAMISEGMARHGHSTRTIYAAMIAARPQAEPTPTDTPT